MSSSPPSDDPARYPFDPGSWSRAIATRDQAAQQWFDRGLNWTYAYNHEEAVVCFRAALDHDPDCAMAWWGIAYASGPFYNRAWARFSDAEIAEALPICHEAASRAVALATSGADAERGLIEAIARRYQAPDELDRNRLNAWHDEFTDAMRAVYRAHPDDLDVIALFVEAAVTRTPRQLWNTRTGEPAAGADTVEAVAALDHGLALARRDGVSHPGIMHMHIHALEMSNTPELALPSADGLRGQSLDAGHLEHMPAHVDVLVGDYAQAVTQSVRAILADDRYVALRGARNFYTTARCHDFHLLMYAAMFLGQYRTALDAADRIRATATPDLIEWSPPFMSAILDGYSAMRTHVLVRFGRWRDLCVEPPPEDPDLTPVRAAMHAYGKGVAHSALGEIEQAEAARASFRQACERIEPDAVFLSNRTRDILAVGAAMLDGELEYRKRDYGRAFASLRLAVARDDALNYTEPWAWMHPPRHALGALLAEQGRFDEAEQVYREDLGYLDTLPRCCQHPDNVWSLHGLLECVERDRDAGDNEARALRQRLAIAKARADVTIESACCCRGMG